jgi:hypothetical protein
MTDTGIDRDDLPQAFAQPNGVAEAITRLVVTEGAGCTNSVTSPDHVICREIVFMHPRGPKRQESRNATLNWAAFGEVREPAMFRLVRPGVLHTPRSVCGTGLEPVTPSWSIRRIE